MNLLTFLSFLILSITLLTMIFGLLAYMLYKIRNKKRAGVHASYEEVSEKKGDPYLFFTKDAA